MKKKYQKKKKKKSKNPKNYDSPKIEKKERGKVEQYLEEHIQSAIWAMFACADFRLVPNHIPTIHIIFLLYLER